MKLQYTTGCICDSLTIDREETISMKLKDVKNVIHKLVDEEKDLAILQNIIIDFVQSHGIYECSGKPCECCGDTVESYTLNI